MSRALSLALLLAALLVGCTDGSQYRQAVAVLVDVSGTYADQKAEVARIVKREVLPSLVPGDTLLLVRIDSQSYDKENVISLTTLDPRPSQANAQKLAIANQLDAFARSDARSEYTDIPGALMLAAEYLREIPAGSRVILVFSDMREDLPEGSKRELAAAEFADIQVVAMNVKRLHSDGVDPARFRGRLDRWEQTVVAHGAAGWRAILDAAQLGGYLASVR
jgi:hypothetical protein